MAWLHVGTFNDCAGGLDMEGDDILKCGNACDHESIADDNTDSSDDGDDCLLDSRIRAKHGDQVIDFEKAHRALVRLICISGVLPDHVEHGPFRDLMDMVCPNFKIDVNLVKSDCLKLYLEEKARIKLIMGNMEGQISLSVDVLKYNVMCLKGHFVDDHRNLRKWVLNFRPIRQCESLADAILMCLKDLDIEGKISTLTLAIDGGEEDEIVEKVKKKVQEKKSFQLKGQLFRVNCAAMFDLMVKDAFEEISMITHKLYELSWRVTGQVAKKMLARLDTYCKEAFMVLAVASVMDPRLKMQHIVFLCSKCEGSDDGARTVLVLDAIDKLYDVYMKQDLEREDSISDSNSNDSEEEFPSGLKQGLCDPLWLPRYKHFIQINGPSPKSDLDWYLEEPVVPWSQDFNALKWWRAESPEYPVLSKNV
ncbi:hypothetical protein RJ639_014666, partial [Escallonia herrerae]